MGQSEDLLLLLNDDVVFEKILPWLPPKSLLKFRSVSKSWYSAISDPDFIAKHQSHYGNNNGFLSLLFTQKYSLLKLRPIPEQQNQNLVVELEDSLLAEDSLFGAHKIMASCNGLFCYATFFKCYMPIYLCNPSIRWTRTIVPFCFSSENNCTIYSTYGVGFDGRTKDYKVIMIEDGPYPYWPIKAALYSVKTNSWKQLNSVPEQPFYRYGYGTVSIFLHGFIHWLSYNKSTYDDTKIVLFDVGNEVFGEMKLPAAGNVDFAPYERSRYGLSISAVRGSLCLLISACDYDNGSICCHMWIMKEYGVVESWTKQAVIEFELMEVDRYWVSRLEELSIQATVGGKIMCGLSGFPHYFGFNLALALFDPQTFEYKIVIQPQDSYIGAVSLVPTLQLLGVTM